MSAVVEVLKRARERISDPSRWTQAAMARTRGGNLALSDCFDAVCWCAVGAVHKECSPINFVTEYDSALRSLAETVRDWRWARDPFFGVTNFNDTHTHAEVLALFDATIARLESEVTSGNA